MKIDRANFVWSGRGASHACNCIGPQNGNPVCPCRMRGLKQVEGRWVEVIDHGPVYYERDDSIAKKTL
jgi:hypothetical protein